jgi:hypothetical protein
MRIGRCSVRPHTKYVIWRLRTAPESSVRRLVFLNACAMRYQAATKAAQLPVLRKRHLYLCLTSSRDSSFNPASLLARGDARMPWKIDRAGHVIFSRQKSDHTNVTLGSNGWLHVNSDPKGSTTICVLERRWALTVEYGPCTSRLYKSRRVQPPSHHHSHSNLPLLLCHD